MKAIIKFVTNIINFFIKILGREVFMYLLFGGLTTVINIAVYYLCTLVNISTGISTTIAFIISVVFAYITNRKWVFESKAKTKNEILNEIWKFLSVRIGTYFMDLGLMILFVDKLGFNGLVCKIIVNILVIVLNYIASKLIIFTKREK